MIVSVVAALLVLLIPGVGDTSSRTVQGRTVTDPVRKPSCAFSLSKIREHRQRTWSLQRTLGARPPIRVSEAHIVGCRYARWVEGLWWRRSVEWGKRARFRVLPDARDWQTAVQVAQRVYPGTSSWLLSCSSAEGGHGAWVWYGGRLWSGSHIGNDFLGMDTVGGNMQFRFSTFEPYSRWAFANVKHRGFVLPHFVTPAGGDPKYAAWLSPLGQALTAGYMRFFGRDGHHWAASYGRGC